MKVLGPLDEARGRVAQLIVLKRAVELVAELLFKQVVGIPDGLFQRCPIPDAKTAPPVANINDESFLGSSFPLRRDLLGTFE